MLTLSSTGASGTAALRTPLRKPEPITGIPPLFEARAVSDILNLTPDNLRLEWRDAGGPVVTPVAFGDPLLSGVRLTVATGSHMARRWQSAGTVAAGAEHRAEMIFRPGSAGSGRLFLREGTSGSVFARITARGFPSPSVAADVMGGPVGAFTDIYLEPLTDGLWRLGGSYRHSAAAPVIVQIGFGLEGVGDVDVARCGLAPAAAARVSPPPLPGFTVADAVAASGDTVALWLDPGWPGWDAAPTPAWRVADGPAITLSPALPGLHLLRGFAPGVAASISLRMTTDGVDGTWSASQSVTPTAASFTRFAVWADGFHEQDLSAFPAVTRIGATTADAAAINKPLTLPGGEEVEYVGGAGSLWVAQFGYAEFPAPTPNPVPEVRHRFFEPAGRHAGLAPLATATVAFKVRSTADGADVDASALVLGAAGGFTQAAFSAVALDGDGDPVAFRFDRLHQVGRLPDGRMFAVAPAGLVLLANSGRQTIPVNTIATWRGASLLVVASAGLIPLASTAVTLTQDYARVLSEPSWSGWPGSVNGSATLSVRAQFETLHLYLQSASATATEVRFRRQGATVWHPAQPLTYDDRTPASSPVDMAAVIPGNHRGIIAHLAPNTTYEVQVRQGTALYQSTVATRSYKPTKAGAALGTVNGDVTITRSGDTVTVARAGLSSLTITAPGYAEIHSGLVRAGGRVTINAARVILRDVDVLAPSKDAIVLGALANDVLIIRGRVAGWAESDLGKRAGNVGWGVQHDAAVKVCFDHTDNFDVAVIGLRTGCPRFHANHWEHYNPSVGDGVLGRGNHPWGPDFISVKQGSYRGGFAVLDCSFAGHRLRPCEDAITGNNNKTRQIGGLGPDSVVAHSYITGMVDDGLELEGSNANLLFLGNWLDLERGVNYTRGPRAGVSVSTGYWGPTVLSRNVLRFQWGSSGFVVPAGQNDQGSGFKVQRVTTGDITQAEQRGHVVLDHNTVFAPTAGQDSMTFFTNSASVTAHLTMRNNLGRQRNAFTAPTGTAVVWTGNNVARRSGAGSVVLPAMVAGTHIPTTAADVDDGTVLANVNDGGPWATTGTPSAGAAQV